MTLPDRKYSSGKGYRFGFQGQETDDEVNGDGNSIYFKYRVHDPRIGRFASIDPLAPKYPWNSPYAFSENRVNDAIELEGLEAFFIHGTRHDYDAWDNVSGLKDAFMQFTNNETFDTCFSWKFDENGDQLNHLMNNRDDRHVAAEMLVNYILANRVEGEELTLIGYSHGGNVSIQAAKMLYDDHGIRVNLITLNTPVSPIGLSWDGLETPFNIEMLDYSKEGAINDHFHFYTKSDMVAGFLSGGDKYDTDLPTADDTYMNGYMGIVLPEEANPEWITTNYKLIGRDVTGNDTFLDPFDPHYLENVDPERVKEKFERKLNPVVNEEDD